MEENFENLKLEIENLKSQIQSLKSEIESLRDKLSHKGKLLEECYGVIHYKGAWLSLSDDNIDGLRKYIKEAKPALQLGYKIWGV